MTNELQRQEMPFALCFLLSFVVSALTTLAVCGIVPEEPPTINFGRARDTPQREGR